jgi:hypothetical protein
LPYPSEPCRVAIAGEPELTFDHYDFQSFRNHDAEASVIAEQIMAMYPIVDGQKPDQTNSIPPQSPNMTEKESNGQPETAPAQAPSAQEGNLIDL